MPRPSRSRDPIPEAPHGTRAGYRFWECGCETCVEWNRLDKIRTDSLPSRKILLRVAKLRRLEKMQATLTQEIADILLREGTEIRPSTLKAGLEAVRRHSA